MARLQIDMLPVGDSDAFLVEWQTGATPTVALIDGGRNWEDGARVIRQVDAYYGGRIDHLILSHIDADHALGLLHIVESLPADRIKHAWVQDLAAHGVDVEEAIARARRLAQAANSSAVRSVAEHMAASIDATRRLLDLLRQKQIPVQEAFAGGPNSSIGPFEVLGPTVDFFERKVRSYDDIEAMDEIIEAGVAFRRRATAGTGPAHHDEVLDSAVDDPEAEKQASLILKLEYDGDRCLFPGDAGREAFAAVEDQETMRNLHILKVPNHGSKHNLNSELLDLFRPALAYISASGIGINPHPALVEALKDRGATVYTTAGSGNVWHRRGDVPHRKGYETKVAR